MSLFKLAQPKTNVNGNVESLRESLSNAGDTFSPELGKSFVGLESEYKAEPALLKSLSDHHKHIEGTIGQALPDLGEVGLESAARAALMLGDTAALATALRSAGLESFSNESLGNYRAETIMVNAMIAEKKSVVDSIYPTVEVGANFGGVTLTLKRFTNVTKTIHPTDGSVMDFGRRHLVEGYRDADALKGASNQLKPVVVTGTNEDLFVPAARVATTLIDGTDGLRTAPLKPVDGKLNLIGLTRLPGQSDSSRHSFNDRIDEGGRVKNLFITFGEDKTGAGGDDEQVTLPISLGMYSAAQFIRGAKVGGNNETHSNLDLADLPVKLSSTAAQAVPALKALSDAGYTRVTLGFTLNSKLQLHTGSLSQTFSSVTVTGVYKDIDANGKSDDTNYLADASITDEVNALKPVFEGQEFDLTLSSKTLRLQGLRVDDQEIDYTFQTTARNVITADRSIDTTDVNDTLTVMTAADVIEREASGVRHLLATISDLDSAYGDGAKSTDIEAAAIPGLAYINRPFVQVESLDIADFVDSLTSTDRFSNISAAIMHLLGDKAAEAMSVTNYVEAKRLYTGNSGAKAEFSILTPRSIGRYLYTEGDDRSFGALDDIEAKPSICTTGLSIMDDTIVMVMKSDAAANGFDAFGWGNTLRAPSVIYDVEITDDGAKRHLQLQPFYEFTNNMPIVYKLTLKGLTEYLRKKNITLTDEV